MYDREDDPSGWLVIALQSWTTVSDPSASTRTTRISRPLATPPSIEALTAADAPTEPRNV